MRDPISKMQEKQWGWTTPQVISPLCEVHLIDVRKGGHCSWHQHDRKHNVFTVISGQLIIDWQTSSPGGEEHHILCEGETYDIPPGVVHRFRCHEPTKALEVYYPASVSPDDIYRFSEGGVEP